MFDNRQQAADWSPPTLSQFDFHARLEALTGAALVMFSGAGCGACRHLRRVFAEVHRQRPDWGLFEIDAGRDQALCNEFEVFHLPTVFLFSDGRFHCQLEAEARPSAIIAATVAALQQAADEAP
ncbi:MAG: thioredoxin family protein [Gammaproteobacteria bacterium]|nr:thioredoxin family protein [Gammaproteobacteria bacterium]